MNHYSVTSQEFFWEKSTQNDDTLPHEIIANTLMTSHFIADQSQPFPNRPTFLRLCRNKVIKSFLFRFRKTKRKKNSQNVITLSLRMVDRSHIEIHEFSWFNKVYDFPRFFFVGQSIRGVLIISITLSFEREPHGRIFNRNNGSIKQQKNYEKCLWVFKRSLNFVKASRGESSDQARFCAGRFVLGDDCILDLNSLAAMTWLTLDVDNIRELMIIRVIQTQVRWSSKRNGRS